MSEEVQDTPSAEEIAQHYTAMGHSVDLINAIVAGDAMAEDDEAERNDTVQRNVDHLEIMLAKDFWSGEDMSAAEAAVTAGKDYLS